jgi:hypothetical protein
MAVGTWLLRDFFFTLFFGNIVEEVHAGISSYLLTISYFFMAISGLIILLYPLSTTTLQNGNYR